MFKILRNLNVRLSLVILLFTLISFVAYFSILNTSYRRNIGHSQSVSVTLIREFAAHPDFNEALEAMPEELRELFVAIRSQQEVTIALVDRLYRNRVLITLLLLVVLGPIFFTAATFISRYLTRPMWRLASATKLLANGDFTVRTNPNLKYWDNYSLALAHDFNAMASSLEHLESERKSMIADIAHELRTPLTSMQLQLEAVQDGIDPLSPTVIDNLAEETKLLSRLVVDLRILSLAEANQLSLDLAELELFGLLEKLRFSFATKAQLKTISLDLEGAEDVWVQADAERLRQVVGNLLNNALRHTPEGGKISIQLEKTNAWAVISVSDTGSGLPEDALEQAFNRFYSSGQTRVRIEGGSGLGLAIVKALTELHGGQVSVQNQAQGGALFKIQLPLSKK